MKLNQTANEEQSIEDIMANMRPAANYYELILQQAIEPQVKDKSQEDFLPSKLLNFSES